MTWTVRKTSSALMDRYSRIPGTSKTWSVEKLSKAESRENLPSTSGSRLAKTEESRR